jgi:hypothetical protein
MFFASGTRLDSINSERKKLNLVIDKPENIPPSIAFATVATGAFRGLVVDALWLRAERLKEEGQFFDAKQLAEWIAVLQPRFTAVWEFLSWNMAYNISVTIPATEPMERWRWIKNGYELIRDKGIPLNPKSIILYRQLAFIFQHKIGGITDDDNQFYKLQLANEMEPFLGKADNEYFEELAAAPKNFNQVTADANFQPFLEQLRQSDKAFEVGTDEFIGNYISLRQNPGRFGPQSLAVIDKFRKTKVLEKFDLFANAYELRNNWKMEPEVMLELNKQFGPVDLDDPNRHYPLDYRHPDSISLYWSYVGIKRASRETFSPEESNTDRMINHSLQDLFRYGKIYIFKQTIQPEPASFKDANLPRQEQQVQAIYLRPDLRMFAPYNKSTLAIINKYKKLKSSSAESMEGGHRNMLKDAVFSFYLAGHRRNALEIYERLRTLYPRDEFKVSIDTYIENKLKEDTESLGINNVRLIIQYYLQEAYFRYAMRDDNQAAQNEAIAKKIYDYYQKLFPDRDRLGLPDFKRLKYFALSDFFLDPLYPDVMKQNLYNRIEIENPELFNELKRQEAQWLKERQETEKQEKGTK